MAFLTQRLIYLERNGAITMADFAAIATDVVRPLDEVLYVTWYLQLTTRRMARESNGGVVGGWAILPVPPRF